MTLLPSQIRARPMLRKRRYVEAIEPFTQSGKLGAVHFQFAPWVVTTQTVVHTSNTARI